MGLLLGHLSHVGRAREINEDAYCVLTPPQITEDLDALLAVADGMGGQQAGEIASRHVVETLTDLFSSPGYRHWVEYSPEREDYFAAVLKEILERLNDHLYSLAATQESLRGMGTTVTVALFAGPRLFIGHVGDSRAYLLRDGQMRRLTQDHSWVEEQVAAGALTPQEAAAHPQKNILTRSLGTHATVRVDRLLLDVQPNDTLILCTDGLTNVVAEKEIQQVTQSETDPQRACDSLVNLANQRGGPDNITVLVARLVTGKGNTKLKGGKVLRYHQMEGERNRVTQKIPSAVPVSPEAKPPRPRGGLLVGAIVVASIALLVAMATVIGFSDAWMSLVDESSRSPLSFLAHVLRDRISREITIGCLGLSVGWLLGVLAAKSVSH